MSGKPLMITLAASALLIAPASVMAQMPSAGSAGAGPAAVSGIPIGPGSAGGLNNSVYDPSGIGNAARVAPPAQGGTGAYTSLPPAAATVAPKSTVYPSRRTVNRRSLAKLSKREQQIRIKENDRLLNRGLTSICRGC